MSRDDLIVLVIVSVFAIFAIIAAFGIIAARKKAEKSEFSEADFPEPKYKVMHAKVLDVKCGTHYEGIKAPKLIKDFFVFFELENGEHITLSVPEAYYGAFEVGQEGSLTLAEGKFIAFSADSGESKC